MYCHQCGEKACGNYCCHCGAKLMVAENAVESLPQDWTNEIRYEVLLRRPEISNLIASCFTIPETPAVIGHNGVTSVVPGK